MKNSEKLLQYTKLYFPATKTATSCGNSILATAAISKAIVWIKIFQSFNERIPWKDIYVNISHSPPPNPLPILPFQIFLRIFYFFFLFSWDKGLYFWLLSKYVYLYQPTFYLCLTTPENLWRMYTHTKPDIKKIVDADSD